MIAPTVIELAELARVNRARTAAGLPHYHFATRRLYAARQHSRDMAARGAIYHADFPLPADWTAWGQNVGEGTTVAGVHTSFMASPEHRANILDRDFTRVAIGIIRVAGIAWVTQNFLAP